MEILVTDETQLYSFCSTSQERLHSSGFCYTCLVLLRSNSANNETDAIAVASHIDAHPVQVGCREV
jgi:hypothetical protein